MRNFGYKNRASVGPRYACIGDAASFLDPVFSSGVSLAMLAAERLAAVLSPAVCDGREGEACAMAQLQTHMAHAYRSVGALVHSFYNTGIVPEHVTGRFNAPADSRNPHRRCAVT